ncbi:hypothetical protein P12x_000098 [Tundrisphaera lichenicola]|uniref:hypothetical protein n=1 Tax=Tundrisphaera lichenicola TaxID=2029860 RepID=UPI003EBBDC98
MNRLALWLDNPLLVKHARSRLRRMQVLPWVAVVMIIALCIVMTGYQYDGLRGGGTFGGLMGLQAIILAIVGAAQVGSSVGKARESGILDFHRASPMAPAAVALGFFFGAPIREYLLFAATLPFSLICVFTGRPSLYGAFQLMVPLVLAAWALHALALFNALAWKSTKSGTRGVVGLVLFLMFGGGGMFAGFTNATMIVDESPTMNFFGLELPWLVVLALYILPAMGFLLIASTRKMASERAHPLSKPEAVACLSSLAFLLMGGLWSITVEFPWTLATLYALILGAIVMVASITPSHDEFVKGVRRAAREGRKYPSAWEDRGLSRIALFCLCAVVLIAPTVVWRAVEEPSSWVSQRGPVSYSLSIAIGVLVVAYFGLALQYFHLRWGKRAGIFMALFLFTAWLIPLLLGSIAAASRTGGPDTMAWPAALFSLSPIVGITLSSGIADYPGHQAAQAAALIPALSFALLFNNLVTSARRRVVKEIHPDPAPEGLAKPEPRPDELAELVS